MKRSSSGAIVKTVSSERWTTDKSALEGLTKEELVEKLVKTSEEAKKLYEDLEKERRRENFATLRLAVKEKLTAELSDEVELMRKSWADERKPDRMMMDHFAGQVFQAMRDKLRNTQKELKLIKLELGSLKNGSESAETRKLVKKCERLEEQNAVEHANAQKISRLEILLAYANKTIDKLRRRQRDVNELLADHDAEVAKLHSEIARLKEENRRAGKSDSVERENLVASRMESTSRGSTVVPEHQEEAEFDLIENNADEMESVSSRESLHEVKEMPESPERVTPEDNEDAVVKVSSSGSEPDDAVVISSPDVENLESGVISDGSEQL